MSLFAQTQGSEAPLSDWITHLVKWMGAFHPAAVHFPIALLLTAAALEVVSVWLKDHSGLRFAIIVNLALGALGAIVASTLGWMDAAHMSFESDLQPVLAWHRWLGTSVGVCSLIITALSFGLGRTGSAASLWIYRVLLWLLALAVGITGYLGGRLAG